MDWLKHALEWLKTSPRYFFPIVVATGILLFAPEHALEPIGVFPIRVNGQPYLGLLFLFSASVIVCDILMKVINLISGWYRNYKLLSDCKSHLKHLTVEEKRCLGHTWKKKQELKLLISKTVWSLGWSPQKFFIQQLKSLIFLLSQLTWNSLFGNISALTQSLLMSVSKHILNIKNPNHPLQATGYADAPPAPELSR